MATEFSTLVKPWSPWPAWHQRLVRRPGRPEYNALCAYCGGDLEEHEAEQGYCARCEKWANEHGLDTDN